MHKFEKAAEVTINPDAAISNGFEVAMTESSKYPLTPIEADVRPEDFPPGIWHDLVKYCGPASVVILAKYKREIGEKLHIRDYSGYVRKAQERAFLVERNDQP